MAFILANIDKDNINLEDTETCILRAFIKQIPTKLPSLDCTK